MEPDYRSVLVRPGISLWVHPNTFPEAHYCTHCTAERGLWHSEFHCKPEYSQDCIHERSPQSILSKIQNCAFLLKIFRDRVTNLLLNLVTLSVILYLALKHHSFSWVTFFMDFCTLLHSLLEVSLHLLFYSTGHLLLVTVSNWVSCTMSYTCSWVV